MNQGKNRCRIRRRNAQTSETYAGIKGRAKAINTNCLSIVPHLERDIQLPPMRGIPSALDEPSLSSSNLRGKRRRSVVSILCRQGNALENSQIVPLDLGQDRQEVPWRSRVPSLVSCRSKRAVRGKNLQRYAWARAAEAGAVSALRTASSSVEATNRTL